MGTLSSLSTLDPSVVAAIAWTWTLRKARLCTSRPPASIMCSTVRSGSRSRRPSTPARWPNNATIAPRDCDCASSRAATIFSLAVLLRDEPSVVISAVCSRQAGLSLSAW
jgi:hypothetical protein